MAPPRRNAEGYPERGDAFNGVQLTAEQQMPFYDAWGSDATYPHFAVGWSWAFDTPYKWMKQIPSFFGGTRQGMAISWPARIGQRRSAPPVPPCDRHRADIVAGNRYPRARHGRRRRAKTIESVSMAYTFGQANADAPSRRQTQYFEMMGVHGLYHDGWMLSAVPLRPPWELLGATILDPANAIRWSSTRSAMTGPNTTTSLTDIPKS